MNLISQAQKERLEWFQAKAKELASKGMNREQVKEAISDAYPNQIDEQVLNLAFPIKLVHWNSREASPERWVKRNLAI